MSIVFYGRDLSTLWAFLTASERIRERLILFCPLSTNRRRQYREPSLSKRGKTCKAVRVGKKKRCQRDIIGKKTNEKILFIPNNHFYVLCFCKN